MSAVSEPLPPVRLAGPADLAAVCSTFADAFHHDPVWGWAFGEDDVRRGRLLEWFSLLSAQAIDDGTLVITDGAEAAALWIAPGGVELNPEREAMLEPMIRRTCQDRAEVVLACFAAFEHSFPTDGDFHYLSLLATADAHRGKGWGMALLRGTLAEFDQRGERAYLESTNPANLRRYESVGFQVHGSFELPGRGQPVTTMWRHPNPR